MGISLKVEGLSKLAEVLKRQTARAMEFHVSSAIVGYGTRYGIYVHEDMQQPHKNGQPKFLTNAEVQVRQEYLKQIKDDLSQIKKDDSLEASTIFYVSCMTIKAASQEMVPKDTGNLHNHAFARVDPIVDLGPSRFNKSNAYGG